MKKRFALGFIGLMTTLVTTSLSAQERVNPVTQDLPNISEAPFPHENPESSLDALIAVTEENLRREKALKGQLQEYRQIHRQYEQNTSNKALIDQLVVKASSLRETIEELHLTHLFDDEFIHELNFFSNISKKWKKNPSQR